MRPCFNTNHLLRHVFIYSPASHKDRVTSLHEICNTNYSLVNEQTAFALKLGAWDQREERQQKEQQIQGV